MAVRTGQFAAIPNIPQSGLTDWQFNTLNAMKENLELLIGARANGTLRAVTTGQVTLTNPPTQTMTRVTATGGAYTISGVTVPSSEDYVQLVANVQALADDVAALRSTVVTLINQLKG